MASAVRQADELCSNVFIPSSVGLPPGLKGDMERMASAVRQADEFCSNVVISSSVGLHHGAASCE
ncbi:MAG: hypothetical protein K2N91_00865 [Muribaculaceae bacterium]|nr:hypothetical protein [Muribaculaceae bacterium]